MVDGKPMLIATQPTPEIDTAMATWEVLNRPPHEQDGMSLDHVRFGHREFDPRCTVCLDAFMRMHQHKRVPEDEASKEGVLAADLKGPLPPSSQQQKYFMVMVKRATKVGFYANLPSKESYNVMEGVKGFRVRGSSA